MVQTTLNKFFTLPETTEDKYYKTKKQDMLKQINNFKYDKAHRYINDIGEETICDSSNLVQERKIIEYINFSDNKEFKKIMLEKLKKYTHIYGTKRLMLSPLLTDTEKKQIIKLKTYDINS